MRSETQHQMETREVPSQRIQSFCQEPNCQFYGREAQQGVCYNTLFPGESRYIQSTLEAGETLLAELKQLRQANHCENDRDWIEHLENHIVCQWSGRQFDIDELVHLRAELGKAKLEIDRLNTELEAIKKMFIDGDDRKERE